MADIRSTYSDYVRFRLKAENVPTFKMAQEPGGWKDDELELDRHKKYHGIFTSFTNKLLFYGDAKDYILAAYSIGGINAILRLSKEHTKDVKIEDDSFEVKWKERYSAIADFNTLQVEGNVLKIKFNSNDLAELIKSHENDAFEIEREDSIDGFVFPPEDVLKLKKIDIEGRRITGIGESQVDLTSFLIDESGIKFQATLLGDPPELGETGYRATRTVVIAQGANQRFSAVDYGLEFDETDPTSLDATGAMFFVDTLQGGEVSQIEVYYSIVSTFQVKADGVNGDIKLDIVRYKFNGTGYDEIFSKQIGIINNIGNFGSQWVQILATGTEKFDDVEFDEGLMFRWEKDSGSGKVRARHYQNYIKVNIKSEYEISSGLSFLFTHDVFERLMYIITGEKNRFYSKFFGRTGLQDINGIELYAQDGLAENGDTGGGLIGMISGFWIRAFNPESEKYKSMQISLKKLFDSCSAVFNVGIGIETVNFKERLRVEELKYFYREEVVVKLPNQITNEKRRIEPKLFQSGIELGYNKGGDYEDEVGLDEPNVKTAWVTPVRRSKNKYKKTSDVRADEYGLERTRRKPQFRFLDEDTNEDEDNWFLDLVREEVLEDTYRQAHYTDRLSETPTNIYDPESFRSMIFTPLRILFRHGWIIRTGLQPYRNKFIKYINSFSNTFLTMEFINDIPRQENSDILVSDLERPRFIPWEITFEHSVDDELSDKIFGTTRVLINGFDEDVPNFYFKFEWINENEEIERGYLMNLKPKGKGKFKMLLANEKLQ